MNIQRPSFNSRQAVSLGKKHKSHFLRRQLIPTITRFIIKIYFMISQVHIIIFVIMYMFDEMIVWLLEKQDFLGQMEYFVNVGSNL